MSGLEEVLLVDTRSLVTLLHSQGTSGLDALLYSGQRVVISRNVLTEMERAPSSLQDTFFDWYSAHSAGRTAGWRPITEGDRKYI